MRSDFAKFAPHDIAILLWRPYSAFNAAWHARHQNAHSSWPKRRYEQFISALYFIKLIGVAPEFIILVSKFIEQFKPVVEQFFAEFIQ